MSHDAHLSRLQSLDDRLARLRTERLRVAARASRAARTRDTRQKILIGATVLAALTRDGVPALPDRAGLLRWLDSHLTRPHDRAVFELSGASAKPPLMEPAR